MKNRPLSKICNKVYSRICEAIDDIDNLQSLLNLISKAKLKSPSDFSKLRGQCKDLLGDEIGKGSSRAVFQIDDARVLKLATIEAGLAQNKQECNSEVVKFGIGPKIYGYARNYAALVSEYVLPATNDDFIKILGISFDIFKYLLNYLDVRDEKITKNNIGSLKMLLGSSLIISETNIKFINSILDYSEQGRTSFDDETVIRDLYGLENWGLVERYGTPKLVALDTGLSTDIYNKFYKFKF